MPSKRRLIFAGILAYLFFLLQSMPAEVLAWAVAKQTAQTLYLADPKGTVWEGSANPVVTNGTQQLELAPLRWHFMQNRLLRGQVAAQLDFATGSRVLLATTHDSVTLENADLTLPASLLGVIFPALSLWQPQGALQIKTPSLRLASQRSDGEAQLLWRSASTSLSRVRPLGDYSFDIRAAQRGVDFTLSTLAGPLTLGGRGYWRSRNEWTFTGQARPRPDRQADLHDLLQLFSRQRDGDKYLLEFSARRETRTR